MQLRRHCEERTDLGFTRDRQQFLRKSGRPDLRARRSNLDPQVPAVRDCFASLAMTQRWARFALPTLQILALMCAFSANAASWPTRPVTIIVPYAAGGMADVIARLVAQQLWEKLGQPFIIHNRGGAAGSIGAIDVARAMADGSVLLFTSPSAILTMPMLQRLNYDTDSFVPISIVANLPFVLAIKSSQIGRAHV